jgi:hypothetical protein
LERITGNITLQQIFTEKWDQFTQLYPELVDDNIQENVEKMLSCRNPEKIGFTQYQCPNHPEEYIRVPHSCKSRFCNTCGKIATDEWISNCHQILPNIEYRHLTFTIPEGLRTILSEVRPLLSCLFTAANRVISSFFTEKKITVASTMVIHTFGRKLNWNPHLHIILSCGGITENMQWKEQGFIPYKMLSKRWKVLLLNTLKEKIQELQKTDEYKEILKPFTNNQFLFSFFKDFYSLNWYTHLSQEKIDMDHTIGYIGRYSRRPVISEAKILEYDRENDEITFEFQDHRDSSPTLWTLSVFKFIQLLIQHIPQKYFHQIRHYGLVANRIAQKFKNLLQKLFGKAQQMLQKLSWRFRQKEYKKKDPLLCPLCSSEMVFAFRAVFSRAKNSLVVVA